MTAPLSRRNKRAPDPEVRSAIVDAASRSIHDQGVRGLNIAVVLERAQLSTRAFYRHFESKDQLVAAVFREVARGETQRLRRKMANTSGPVGAVAAWIDRHLDLAFDENTELSLRRHPRPAVQSEALSSSETLAPAYAAILEPLIEQLQRGLELGAFKDIVPMTAARSIDGVVWAGAQPQWSTDNRDRSEVRERALRFCLHGLGVAAEIIEQMAGRDAPAG
jgi:AcrR family transcriptional regulator